MSRTLGSVCAMTSAGAPLDHLHEMLGPDASFRPGQLEAIEAVARDRGRVLLVQRTGWGKSAVYFIATQLLREQGAGPTLLVSPLLALMRNQIEMAARIGVRAETINSTNPDEFEPIVQRLADDEIDLLLVSPERFANERFRDEMLSVIARTVGLLVVDEAHCISDWGHDFRPDYRRIVRVLEALPADVPVLCTTATANDRVIADITDQLGVVAAHLPRHARPREPGAGRGRRAQPGRAHGVARRDDPRRWTARASSTCSRSPTASGWPRSCAARASRPRPTAAPPTTTTASAWSRRCSRTS